MNITLRIFLILLVTSFIIMIIHKVKDKKISMRYASIWLITLILLIIAIVIPNIIIKISFLLGFEASSNMIFLIGFFILACLIFNLTISLSKLNEKAKDLIQEISILKMKVEKNEERK